MALLVLQEPFTFTVSANKLRQTDITTHKESRPACTHLGSFSQHTCSLYLNGSYITSSWDGVLKWANN
jgi:hypothetical protein